MPKQYDETKQYETKQYANGQITYEQKGDVLTYSFKEGKVKAEGLSFNGEMQGQWKFNRETGQLWQVGNFKNKQKDGNWFVIIKITNWNMKKHLATEKL